MHLLVNARYKLPEQLKFAACVKPCCAYLAAVLCNRCAQRPIRAEPQVLHFFFSLASLISANLVYQAFLRQLE